jgi:hypothetical protein
VFAINTAPFLIDFRSLPLYNEPIRASPPGPDLVHRKGGFEMIYVIPKEEGFLEVKPGDYICDKCNEHIQNVKPVSEDSRFGYLKPCEKCGCTYFYGFK